MSKCEKRALQETENVANVVQVKKKRGRKAKEKYLNEEIVKPIVTSIITASTKVSTVKTLSMNEFEISSTIL